MAEYKDIDFHNLKLFVYRELKDGSIAMARPCPSCMALIKDLGIKKYIIQHQMDMLKKTYEILYVKESEKIKSVAYSISAKENNRPQAGRERK